VVRFFGQEKLANRHTFKADPGLIPDSKAKINKETIK